MSELQEPPPDEVSEWAAAAAASIAETALDVGLEHAMKQLVAQTPTLDEAYQILSLLPKIVAEVLRPNGAGLGPIGHSRAVVDRLPPAGTHRVVDNARGVRQFHVGCLVDAARMIGYAAQSDAEMVRAFALACIIPQELDAEHTLFRARSVAGAMLLVLIVEPVRTTPPKGTPDGSSSV